MGSKAYLRKRRLQNILITLIHDSFPSLIGLTIGLVKSKDKDEFLACSGNRWEGFSIYYSKAIDDLDDNQLLGVAAHELCHIEELYRWHPVIAYFESIACSLVPFIDSYIERRTDRIVIQKGYGANLLAFQKYHDRKYESYTKADGLTKMEIKQLLKNQRS